MIKTGSRAGIANTLLLKLVFFTISVTLLTVLLSGIVPYLYLRREMRSTIETYNNLQLENVQELLDGQVFDRALAFLSDMIVSDDRYGLLESVRDDDGRIMHYKLTEVREALQSKMAADPSLFSDVLIYYSGSRVLLSAEMGVRYLDEPGVKSPFDLSWLPSLERIYAGRTVTWLGARDTPDTREASLSYTRKCFSMVFASYGRAETVYVCFNIPVDQVERLMRRLGTDPDVALVLTSPDGVAAQINATEKVLSAVGEWDPSPASETGEPPAVSGDQLYLRSRAARAPGFHYLIAVPESRYRTGQNQLSKTVALAVLLVFCAIVLVACLYIFRLTSPFGRLWRAAAAVHGPDGGGERSLRRNEFSLVADVLDRVTAENTLQQQLLTGNRALVRDQLCNSLLLGRMPGRDMFDAAVRFTGARFDGPCFTVALLQSMPGSPACMGFEGAESLFARALGPYGPESVRCYDEMYALIVGHGENDRADILSRLHNAAGDVVRSGCTPVMVAVGRSCRGAESVGASYRDAQRVFEYFTYRPDGWVLDGDALDRDAPDAAAFPGGRDAEEFIRKLVSAVQAGHADIIRKSFEALGAGLRARHAAPEAAARFLERLACVYDEWTSRLGEGDGEDLSARLDACFFMDKRLDILCGAFVRCAARTPPPVPGLTAGYAARAVQFIGENYCRDLSVQEIADNVGISRYHLCRVFKEYTGETLTDYITALRMKRARELLGTTHLSVQEVAQSVGFNNISYFNRKFRQYFGATPSSIR